MATDIRIDYYPTHEQQGIKFRRGHALPFGATMVPNGINFSIYSSEAIDCTLVLFERGEAEPFAEIRFPEEFRTGNVYSMIVFDLDYERLEYGYRMDGPFKPEEGHRFDKSIILSDPYAKAIGGRDSWLAKPNWDNIYPYRSRLVFEDFDWENDHPLETPIEDLVIYEMHVRGFTQHPSSNVKNPGTFAAIRSKIAYLKELGINCVELMPIYEFDEWENSKENPVTGGLIVNFWGYSTVNFFSPKAGYAATGKFGMQVDELKTLVKELHKNGIEVMLDVVFNHTAEGDHRGHTISFRGIDNKTYYMLTPEGYYFNFSGTGNTLNCNNPVVRNMVLDCLRYWAADYHIDGFRFDLAAILGRDQNGAPLSNPPLLESLAYDPILAKCKLVAEAWDAGGLYQVGSFPAYGRWAEWNGKYRDSIRKFLKGDEGLVGEIAQCIQGWPDLYYYRGPTASINFIACHDGFTLYDLFAYNEKHNEANGENNNDGGNDNHSWNCGVEGETDDAFVNQLRHKQIKNALSILMVSQGVPMILSGDEVGVTKSGNNNTYCHDNELNWLDWSLMEKNSDIFYFAQRITRFRRAHPVLRSRTHFQHKDYVGSGFADITFHGTQAWHPDFSSSSRCIAFMLDGAHAKSGTIQDDSIYIAMNSHYDALYYELPPLPNGKTWHLAVNTDMPSGEDIYDIAKEPKLEDQGRFLVGGRATVILVGK
ncbi:glycogen debranching protein GlgX [Dyadobacter fanqingshengii]|uniref:Glycogen debranching protein GlgX n=1 Tax=Dyadobacter fanqingshengii TaxID=2906443 RepID=A0A9X1P9Q0_9BACT|nr:glycogen debranching protein GlgX [Dyadobacter fanqingshengii]MCF0040607.1 glycogen debranching protein GlgX [Dyadobacter fanqingshengii]USJ37655.1 glycogen debranching protein GlgX [Dyadobacter fanqingshengii]